MINIFWNIVDSIGIKNIQKKEVRNEKQFFYKPDTIKTEFPNTTSDVNRIILKENLNSIV